MMPGMTGVDVLETLRADGAGADRRVVLLTGGAMTEAAEACIAEATNPVLEKPIDAEALREAVRRVVDVSRAGRGG